MRQRIKMVDIARAANVSRTTVSLVLNQIPGTRIAEATRLHVLQVARDLGYAPGPVLAPAGDAGATPVGVLINEISAAYPIDLVDGLRLGALAQGRQIVICVTDTDAVQEAAALAGFARLGITDVVYATSFSTLVDPSQALTGFRSVLVNCRRADGTGLSIMPAERQGGRLATAHLVSLGCERIATITGDPWQWASIERLAGYGEALAEAGLAEIGMYRHVADWSHAGGHAAASALLSMPTPPDAIFCHNDIMARGALAAARDLGRTVPGDVAIIGYDNREFAGDLGISTLSLPLPEMAEQAMAALAGTRQGSGLVEIAGALLPRASTLG